MRWPSGPSRRASRRGLPRADRPSTRRTARLAGSKRLVPGRRSSDCTKQLEVTFASPTLDNRAPARSDGCRRVRDARGQPAAKRSGRPRFVGITATASSGAPSASRRTRCTPSSGPRQARAAGKRCGEIVGVAVERNRFGGERRPSRTTSLRRRSRPRSPPRLQLRWSQARARAGSCSAGESDSPPGLRPARRHAPARFDMSVGELARPSPATSTANSPGSTSSSFQRSRASAMQSKPEPRFAVVAGAATRHRCSRAASHRPPRARLRARHRFEPRTAPRAGSASRRRRRPSARSR